jgi:Electron transfer DM13
MKKLIACSIPLLMLFSACKKEKTNTGIVSMDPVDSTAQLQYRSVFSDGPYGTTMGVAKIFKKNNTYSLVLDSFSVNSGPDLHVYLSKERQPINFIDLGVLRTTTGTQVYNISGMPNFMEYKFALIHCQAFDHLFGSANFY